MRKSLKRYQLTPAPGDFVTIIGGNGAGKIHHVKYDRRRISDRFR